MLENIVGRSFLPRGSGIVTRCPCEIRMHALPEGQQAYALVASAPDPATRYDDFEAVRAKIEQETFRVCGPRGLSTTPILLDVYSPDVVNLTLVDLPGDLFGRRSAGAGARERERACLFSKEGTHKKMVPIGGFAQCTSVDPTKKLLLSIYQAFSRADDDAPLIPSYMTFSHPPPSFSFIFFPYLLVTTTTPIPSQLLAPTSGAVRIAAEGQDPRIVAQIRDMILDYIKRDNVIIRRTLSR